MQFVQLMNEMKSQKVRSTLRSLEEFKTGSIWQDICAELNAWLIDTYEHLEDQENVYSVRELDQFRGRARNIKEALQMVDQLIEIKKQEVGDDS